jgi:redox-regulated HSP33 family molecular chaperone
VNAVTALGLEGILQVLDQEQERELVIDCEFCRKRYVIPEEELRAIARALSARDGGAQA